MYRWNYYYPLLRKGRSHVRHFLEVVISSMVPGIQGCLFIDFLFKVTGMYMGICDLLRNGLFLPVKQR